MKTSEHTGVLFARLAQAQGKFINVLTTADNPFHKSKYAPLDAVLSMVRPILADHELTITHGIMHLDGQAYLQTRISTFELNHDDKEKLYGGAGQWIEDDGVPLLMRTKDKNNKDVEPTMQNFAAACTYAKRLSLQAMLSIASTGEDDDGETAQGEWAGPMKKHELSEAARALFGAIQSAETMDELKLAQVNAFDVIEQLQHDLPKWYSGDGEDSQGLKECIRLKREDLETDAQEIPEIV